MKQEDLRALADRVEGAAHLDADLALALHEALGAAFPAAAGTPALEARPAESVDAALHVAATALPDWSVTIEGKVREPSGRWTCTLRESRAVDDDEVIGIGKSGNLPFALFAAILRVGAMRTEPRG